MNKKLLIYAMFSLVVLSIFACNLNVQKSGKAGDGEPQPSPSFVPPSEGNCEKSVGPITISVSNEEVKANSKEGALEACKGVLGNKVMEVREEIGGGTIRPKCGFRCFPVERFKILSTNVNEISPGVYSCSAESEWGFWCVKKDRACVGNDLV